MRGGARRAIWTPLLGLAAGWAAAAPATADEIIPLREGPPIVGEVLSAADDALRVRTGDAILKLAFGKVKRGVLYKLLKARTDLESAAARVELAGTLVRFADYGAARTELRAAKALDPSLRTTVALKMADVDDAEAGWLYQSGMEAMVEKRFADAVTHLEAAATRFAGSPAAEKARALLPKARAEAATAKKAAPAKPEAGQAAPVSKRSAKLAKAITALLAKVDANVKAADTAHRTGLRWDAKGQTKKAADGYEEAAKQDRESRGWLDRILAVRDHAPEELVKQTQDRVVKVDQHLVLVYRSLGALYMVRQNFKQAREAVLLALEIDPQDKAVLQLKAKIESQMLKGVTNTDDGTKKKPLQKQGGAKKQ